MSHLVRVSNSLSPKPTDVVVLIRLRDEVHAKNPNFLGILENRWFKKEFEAETPQFLYHFVVGSDCDESILSDRGNVVIISDCPKTWLELYEKAKTSEPRRIGGALVLGGETLDDEMRKTLEEKTGGQLPFSLPSSSINVLWEMVLETLKKAESILIRQNSSGEDEDSDVEEHDRTCCVSEAESDRLLIESFVAIFGCTYTGQSSEYMEKAITDCWNWLHRIFHKKQKALVEQYRRENRNPSTEEAKKEIKRNASEHTEIILRKFRSNESDCQIRGYMVGLHEQISKVESGEIQPYFPQEYLPGKRPLSLMNFNFKENNDTRRGIKRKAPERTEVVVMMTKVITNKKGEQKTVVERTTQTRRY